MAAREPERPPASFGARADGGARVRRLTRVLLGPWGVAALVVALTATVWSLLRAGPYRLDDFATPLDDPASGSLGAFFAHLRVTLRPVTKLTYALEASLGVTEAPARRVLTAAIHGLGAGAMTLLGVRLGVSRLGAALVALAWALHPVHAEAVLSVAGRSAALGTAMVLVALACAACDRPIAAAAALGVAIGAREATAGAVVALAILTLARGAAGERPSGAATSWAAWRRLAPMLTSLVVCLTFALTRPRAQVLAEYSFHGRPWLASTVQQVSAIPLGLSLLVRPSALACDHGEALARTPTAGLFLLGVTLSALAIAAAAALVRRAPIVAAGIALWIFALLPTQSIVPKLDPLTERPIAYASAGVALVALALTRAASARRPARIASLAACLAACLLLARATFSRGMLYASDVALWSDAAAKTVDNPRPLVELALALDAEGRRVEAIAALRRAQAIDPFDSSVNARLRLWERAATRGREEVERP